MKISTIFLLLGLVVLTTSCSKYPKEEADSDVEKQIETLCSGLVSANECDMRWRMQFDQTNFPENFEMVLNDKVIYDHCTRSDSRVAVTTDGFLTTITIWDFIRLKNEDTFGFTVNKIADCNSETRKVFYSNAAQKFDIRSVNGVEYLVLRTGN